MAQSLRPDQFASAVNSILTEYREAIDKDVQAITKDISKQAAKNVQRNIDAAGIKGTGAYKKSIKAKQTLRTVNKASSTIYAEKPYWRLTHLLEFGHAKVNGGRTRAFPHWEKAEQQAIRDFEKALTEAITK